MSLQMLWALIAAHPAKLINVVALLVTCPGGLLLHSARRREAQALAGAPSDEAVVDGMTLRINRFYYILGFAFLALALLLSWFSTWV
jgi:preprotein translocase subunit SecG